MQPTTLLDSTTTADGRTLTLLQRGDEFFMELDREPLMSSRQHASEQALATRLVAELAAQPAPHLLIGGLGMGFTVGAALAALGARPRAVVEVAEVFPAVVAWNRGVLADLAGRPLDDPRVRVVEDDVVRLVAVTRARWHAILLDVDNGPDAFTLDANRELYTPRGLARLRAALRPGGLLGVWSAFRDDRFAARLERAGFQVEVVPERSRPGGRGSRHVLFLGRRPASPPNRRGK